jgi:hypothetical protein
MAKVRGQTYRRLLAHLSDAAWFHAVDAAIEAPGGWFPSVGDLLDDAARAPHPEVKGYLAADTRTVEERRAESVSGLRLVKGAYEEAVKAGTVKAAVPRGPVAPTIVEASDERMDMLRRQAEEITRES